MCITTVNLVHICIEKRLNKCSANGWKNPSSLWPEHICLTKRSKCLNLDCLTLWLAGVKSVTVTITAVLKLSLTIGKWCTFCKANELCSSQWEEWDTAIGWWRGSVVPSAQCVFTELSHSRYSSGQWSRDAAVVYVRLIDFQLLTCYTQIKFMIRAFKDNIYIYIYI